MSVEITDSSGPLRSTDKIYGRIAGQAGKAFSPDLVYDFIKTQTDLLYPTQSELSSLDDYVTAFALVKNAVDNTKWDGQNLIARGFASATAPTDLVVYQQLQDAVLAANFDIPGLADIGTVDPSLDLLVIYDASASNYKSVTPTGLISALDLDLAALADLSGTGFAVRTAANTWAQRSMANAAAGLTWTNPAGIAGNPTPVFANDLGALEALSSTGIAVRTATDTWAQRTITGTANEIELTYGDGVSGNPTVSLPSALTFTGKTINGGTFASPAAITGLPDPTGAQDAATKAYVDTVAAGLDPKASVKVATTANITLSGEQTIDGVLTAASRVLVKNQSTASQNGIYVSAAGAWARTSDFDNWSEVPGAFVFVEEGTTNANTGWTCTSDTGGSIGSTAVNWTQFAGAGTFTADGSTLQLTGTVFSIKDVELLALAGLTSAADALPYFTGSGTAATTTLTSFMRTVLDDADAATARATLGLTIGTNVQAFDAELAAIAGLASAADKLPYFTGSGTAALADFTTFGRSLVDDANASAARTTLGLAIGTDVQAYNARLADIAGITYEQGDIFYYNGTSIAKLPAGTTGQVLQSGGPLANPSWISVSGTGTVTSITAGNGLTSTLTATAPGSAITASGALSAARVVNAQTGTSYTVVDGDRAKIVTFSNTSAVAVTLPQAGAASEFQSGWFATIKNLNRGAVTITPTTSTINGASSLDLQRGQSAVVVSDGANYQTVTSRPNVVVQTFTSSGTYTPTLGMSYCEIYCLGGGGGGGGVAGSSSELRQAGGGGAGSLAVKIATASDIGASQVVTIGSGGSGGGAGANNGVSGGDTSVGSLCIGKGGSGGSGTSTAGSGGSGGVAGTGDITGTGANGGSGNYHNAGGSFGILIQGGSGASTLFGGGGFGGSPSGGSASAGGAGSGYGAGGGGATATTVAGNAAGGAGRQGLAWIVEYIA